MTRSCCIPLLLLAACGDAPDPVPPSAAGPAAVAPTLADARGLSYPGILDTVVTLRDGVYEGQPLEPGAVSRLRVSLARDAIATGDLTGDGVADAAVLLAANDGGSGVVTYVAVVTGQGGGARTLGTADLGDRVQVRSMEIADGVLTVDLIAAGPEDAACCPSHQLRRRFALRDGALVETGSEDLGPFTSDALDGEWRLVAWDVDEPHRDTIAVTLALAEQRASGSSGCNRYTGPFALVAGSQDLSPGPFAGTRRLCAPPVMDVEGRYLEALEGVMRWGFLNGRLALTYRLDDGLAALLFEPVGPLAGGWHE